MKTWLLKRSALFRWILGRENEFDVYSPGPPRPMTGIIRPDVYTALEMAKAGQGAWVRPEDMYPACNVADRVYRTTDGHLGVYSPYGSRGVIDAWFFPHVS